MSAAVLLVAIAIAGGLAMLTKDMTNVRDEPRCAQVMLVDANGDELFFQDVHVEERNNGVRIIELDGRVRDIHGVEQWTCTPPD